MKTIILTGGGTAGHVTPHFAILEDLKKHFDKIYYIGSENGIEEKLVKDMGIKYFKIPTTKLKRSLTIDNFFIPFTLLKSIKECKKLLIKLKPDVIFSKGGFVGLPVTIAGKLLKIPVVIHESDRSLGLANKIASSFSSKTLLTFNDTKCKNNGMFVGAIIRPELFNLDREKALSSFGFSGKKPIILVMGGSLGAKFLNDLITDKIDDILKDFDVLNITGKGNLRGINKRGFIETEFTDMHLAYSCCDIAISRVGSNTLFELLALKKPTLFVPLPKTQSRGDQIENAEYITKNNLSMVCSQEDLNNQNFLNLVKKLYSKKDFYIKNLSSNKIEIANKKIVEILSKYWQAFGSIIKYNKSTIRR